MKIETKFSVNQVVFFMSNNKVIDGTIDEIIIDIDYSGVIIKYRLEGLIFYESDNKLFGTKPELLESL